MALTEYPRELRRQATTRDDLRRQPEEIAHTAPIDGFPVVHLSISIRANRNQELLAQGWSHFWYILSNVNKKDLHLCKSSVFALTF